MAETTTAATALRVKAQVVLERLVAVYGWKPQQPHRDAMHELVTTMLSHRTTRADEKVAYERMWAAYGSWSAIQHAPVDELIDLISTVQYPEVKAPNIQRTLARIEAERGEYAIDFLAALPAGQALAWLMSLPGVGLKTASLVLLFNFGQPVLPVDTHVHRVSGRLGLIGPRVSAEKSHTVLLDLLPNDADTLFNFHKCLYYHGQKVCVWGAPRCQQCPLRDICDYYQQVAGPSR
jgi:endonuclease-3